MSDQELNPGDYANTLVEAGEFADSDTAYAVVVKMMASGLTLDEVDATISEWSAETKAGWVGMSDKTGALIDRLIDSPDPGPGAMEIDPGPDASLTTPASEEFSAKKEQSLSKLVALTIKTLDPKSMTRRYAAMGEAFIKHCQFQKSSIKTWIARDYDTAIDRVTDAVRMESAITDVRMNTYVRVHVFVSCVKPIVPGVESLSYNQIANKFLPMISWDKVELAGEIRAGWVTFLQTIIPIQLSDSPLNMADLDTRIADHKTELESDKSKKTLDPDAELAAAQKKRDRELTKARTEAIATVSESMDNAIIRTGMSPKDLYEILASVAESNKLEAPSIKVEIPVERIVGIDPATATLNQFVVFFNVMLINERWKEIRKLHQILGSMIEQERIAREDEARLVEPVATPVAA